MRVYPNYKWANQSVSYRYIHTHAQVIWIRKQTSYFCPEDFVSAPHTLILYEMTLEPAIIGMYLYHRREILKLWNFDLREQMLAHLSIQLFRDSKKDLYSKCKQVFSGEGRENLVFLHLEGIYRDVIEFYYS